MPPRRGARGSTSAFDPPTAGWLLHASVSSVPTSFLLVRSAATEPDHTRRWPDLAGALVPCRGTLPRHGVLQEKQPQAPVGEVPMADIRRRRSHGVVSRVSFPFPLVLRTRPWGRAMARIDDAVQTTGLHRGTRWGQPRCLRSRRGR